MRRAFTHHDTLHRQATAYHLATGGMQSMKLTRAASTRAIAGGAPYSGHVGAYFGLLVLALLIAASRTQVRTRKCLGGSVC